MIDPAWAQTREGLTTIAAAPGQAGTIEALQDVMETGANGARWTRYARTGAAAPASPPGSTGSAGVSVQEGEHVQISVGSGAAATTSSPPASSNARPNSSTSNRQSARIAPAPLSSSSSNSTSENVSTFVVGVGTGGLAVPMSPSASSSDNRNGLHQSNPLAASPYDDIASSEADGLPYDERVREAEASAAYAALFSPDGSLASYTFGLDNLDDDYESALENEHDKDDKDEREVEAMPADSVIRDARGPSHSALDSAQQAAGNNLLAASATTIEPSNSSLSIQRPRQLSQGSDGAPSTAVPSLANTATASPSSTRPNNSAPAANNRGTTDIGPISGLGITGLLLRREAATSPLPHGSAAAASSGSRAFAEDERSDGIVGSSSGSGSRRHVDRLDSNRHVDSPLADETRHTDRDPSEYQGAGGDGRSPIVRGLQAAWSAAASATRSRLASFGSSDRSPGPATSAAAGPSAGGASSSGVSSMHTSSSSSSGFADPVSTSTAAEEATAFPSASGPGRPTLASTASDRSGAAISAAASVSSPWLIMMDCGDLERTTGTTAAAGATEDTPSSSGFYVALPGSAAERPSQ